MVQARTCSGAVVVFRTARDCEQWLARMRTLDRYVGSEALPLDVLSANVRPWIEQTQAAAPVAAQ